jgi:hypothetical protein
MAAEFAPESELPTANVGRKLCLSVMFRVGLFDDEWALIDRGKTLAGEVTERPIVQHWKCRRRFDA